MDLLVLLVSVLDGHLAELPGEAGGALTLVPGAAFAAIDTREMTHHYSEVWCCQGVCGVAVLTDDGGGVSLLAVVVTSASYAGIFADSWGEDHLDPSCMVANMNRVVSHRQGDRPLRLRLDMGLCVCAVCVVVFRLQDVLLALPGVHGSDLLLDVLLDVMRSYVLRRRLDRQFHLGHVAGQGRGGGVLRDGPLRDHVVSVAVSGRVPVCVPVSGSTSWHCGEGVCGHLVFARLPAGARLADTELRPQAHSSILALRDAIGFCAPL